MTTIILTGLCSLLSIAATTEAIKKADKTKEDVFFLMLDIILTVLTVALFIANIILYS